jgi:hypothetical protein
LLDSICTVLTKWVRVPSAALCRTAASSRAIARSVRTLHDNPTK